MSETSRTGSVLVLNSSRFGQGNPRLGESLMKGFLLDAAKSMNRPDAVLLYNSAVVLACSDSPVLESIQKLAESGSRILVNRESLEFYSLDSNLVCGESAGLDLMTECMLEADVVLKP